MRRRRTQRSAGRRSELRDAFGLLISVWTALALGGALAPALGREPALLASFGLATAICAADRATRGRTRPRAHLRGRGRLSRAAGRGHALASLASLARFAGFVAAGLVLAPPLAATTLSLAALAELDRALAPAVPPSAAEALASLVLAPCFEEHLYRGRLLPALAGRIGGAGALVATSALFALPHLAPLAVLGAFVAGLVLGALGLATRRGADCIALHAGLNGAIHGAAAGLCAGAPALPPAVSLAAAFAFALPETP